VQGYSSMIVCLQEYSTMVLHMVVFVRSWFALCIEDIYDFEE
jgi:hypothetical protein